MRRTTIPKSSFLIPHSRKAFIHNQWAEPPKELTPNPEPSKFVASHSRLCYNKAKFISMEVSYEI